MWDFILISEATLYILFARWLRWKGRSVLYCLCLFHVKQYAFLNIKTLDWGLAFRVSCTVFNSICLSIAHFLLYYTQFFAFCCEFHKNAVSLLCCAITILCWFEHLSSGSFGGGLLSFCLCLIYSVVAKL